MPPANELPAKVHIVRICHCLYQHIFFATLL